MATPNLVNCASIVPATLAADQLDSGDNDYTVPTNHAWFPLSLTLANVGEDPVTITGSVVEATVERTFLPAEVIAAGDVLVVDPTLISTLPEAAVLRINADTSASVDVLLKGLDAS